MESRSESLRDRFVLQHLLFAQAQSTTCRIENCWQERAEDFASFSLKAFCLEVEAPIEVGPSLHCVCKSEIFRILGKLCRAHLGQTLVTHCCPFHTGRCTPTAFWTRSSYMRRSSRRNAYSRRPQRQRSFTKHLPMARLSVRCRPRQCSVPYSCYSGSACQLLVCRCMIP
jgi:hypothetical protein